MSKLNPLDLDFSPGALQLYQYNIISIPYAIDTVKSEKFIYSIAYYIKHANQNRNMKNIKKKKNVLTK